MPSAELLERLAAVIHDLWREDAASDGLTFGPEFDELAGTHDALVPFDQLKATDRRDALTRAETWASTLTSEVEYPRGPNPELCPEEMYKGMPVGWVIDGDGDEAGSTEEDPCDDIGHIIDWTVAPDGKTLETVRVEWPDKCVREYIPMLLELRRVS